MGIEPTLFAWEAKVLPLNYTRFGLDYRSGPQGCRNPVFRERVADGQPSEFFSSTGHLCFCIRRTVL